MLVWPMSCETQPITVRLWTVKAMCVDLKVLRLCSVVLVS